jgi:hypothetical protein
MKVIKNSTALVFVSTLITNVSDMINIVNQIPSLVWEVYCVWYKFRVLSILGFIFIFVYRNSNNESKTKSEKQLIAASSSPCG